MIIIETDLDFETAKERFLENVCKKPIWVAPINPIELKKWKDKAFGGIDGNKIWFDNSGLAQNRGITKHEFGGIIEEKNGKAVISGEFDTHYGSTFLVIVLLIILIIYMGSLLKNPNADTKQLLICFLGIPYVSYGVYNMIYGFKGIEERTINALCEIFETTRVYNDEDDSDERDNGL